MDINKVIARQIAQTPNSKTKLIKGNVVGNVDPLKEWIKWLSYESVNEKNRKGLLSNKKVYELTIDDLSELTKYKNQKRMAELFKKYDNLECNENEYIEVYDYMCDNSINDLMIDKLSKEELEKAKIEIKRLSSIPKKELSKYVNDNKKNEIYKDLSMVDSYILHVVADIDFNRSMLKLDSEIKHDVEKNENMRFKSKIYANNPLM